MPSVIDVVERSSQRGGRMLSVLDLLDAGTLSLDLAAWLLERVASGSSWLVGARPGGAGKTTIMGALIAMLPEGTTVHLAAGSGWRKAAAGECVVACEIGPGEYEGYVWAEELRTFASLAERGCRLVSNLHADTLEQAREQMVAQNGVSEGDFDRLDLFLPIRLDGTGRRARPFVPAVWRSRHGAWERVEHPELGEQSERARSWLAHAQAGEVRSIEEVRAAWLRFWSETHRPWPRLSGAS